MVVYLKNGCPIPPIPCYGDDIIEMTQSHGMLVHMMIAYNELS